MKWKETYLGGSRPGQRNQTMIIPVHDENLVRASAHGDAPEELAQLAHPRYGRRVEHAQDGAFHGQHLHAMMLVSDHQGPSARHRHGPGEEKLSRLPTPRSQLLPHSAVAKEVQEQPMEIALNHDDNGAFLQSDQ